MDIEIVRHGSELYWAAIALRTKVLREPLGLSYSKQDIEEEQDQIHIVGRLGDAVVGCLSLLPAGSNIKMRQVAVEPKLQGSGLGKELVLFSENLARAKGCAKIVLHARDTAVAFYQRLGYEVVGEGFIEVTIPHHAMEKLL